MKAYPYPSYPVTKSAFLKRQAPPVAAWLFIARGILPTLSIIVIAELVVHYTGSGYSVVVIMLLCVLLYTTYRYGRKVGLISSVLIVLYNMYIVSLMIHSPLVGATTLQRSIIITLAFPFVTYIIGRLKHRNDVLLDRAQEARLRAEESARQLHLMAEAMPQMIFTTTPSGKNVYMNSQWLSYTGAPKKIVSKWSNVVHAKDLQRTNRLWKESITTGAPLQLEHRLKRADGVYVWHLTRAEPLRDTEGKITLWVGSSTDIEDIRRARKLEADTARLKRQRSELLELNKAKDEFISLASHQLRTPATSVKQYVNMALEGYAGELSPMLRQFLETANKSNERQLSIINDLLKVAQVDAGKVTLHKERVDIDDMLASIIRDYQSALKERSQTIVYHPKRRNITLQADPTKLRMILENVIDNASKYSLANKTISISVNKYRKNVKIAVKDQGVGIDKADTEKVFEKFSRLDNPLSTKVGGNGLGLYWARKVVKLHGGTITVTPHAGDGTTFTLSLPVNGE